MGALKMAAVNAVTLVVVAFESMNSEYQCGPYCPPPNETMKSCETVCPTEERELDPFAVTNLARFSDGTPCWVSVDGQEPGPEGVCCDGECNEDKNACKSKMSKCKLLDTVKRLEAEEAERRRKQKAANLPR